MARRFLKEKLPLQALDTLDETCDQDTFEEVLSYPYDIFDLSLEQLIEKMDITRKKGYKCGPKVLLNVLTLLSKCNLGKMYSSYMQSLFFDMIREHPMLVAKQEFSQVVLDNNLDNSMFIKQLICKEAFTLNGMVDPDLLISTCGCKVDRYGWRETLHLLLEMVEPERAYQSALDAATGDEVVFSIIREAMHAKVIVDPTEALLFTCSRDISAKKELLASGLKAGLLKLNDYIISQMIPIMDAEAVMLFELACKGSYPLPESLRSVLDMQCNIGVTLLFEAWCNLEKADKETCLKLAERLTAEVLPREALFILNTHLKFDKSPEVAEAVKAASTLLPQLTYNYQISLHQFARFTSSKLLKIDYK
ncbi:hypothetical protein SELMODRAFT_427893 [Selaginella moellendorffii]|uniref:Uncharacterized protein n=1 Tax=Selaginella moellendorffii TaxID=88036 RepID=D8T116_SELML|nr:hypothetical protein SELMODRAFT_427893 [Selaginella moellendorffii]